MRLAQFGVLGYFGGLPPCLVGIAGPLVHHWSRELPMLGHSVRLIPTNFVKAYLTVSSAPKMDCLREFAAILAAIALIP